MQLAIVKSISSLLLKIKTCAIKKNFLLIKKKNVNNLYSFVFGSKNSYC